MLPGFGAGNASVYQQDLDMLITTNGNERHLDDWDALAQGTFPLDTTNANLYTLAPQLVYVSRRLMTLVTPLC